MTAEITCAAPDATAAKQNSKAEAVPEFLPLFRRAFDLVVQEDGWAHLGMLGQHLRQLDPGFDPRTYGFKQLSLLVRGHPEIFEVRGVGEQGASHIYVRLKSTDKKTPRRSRPAKKKSAPSV